ncbi:hypothetical protein TNCT_677581, partial [Trichonephila clavata]
MHHLHHITDSKDRHTMHMTLPDHTPISRIPELTDSNSNEGIGFIAQQYGSACNIRRRLQQIEISTKYSLSRSHFN